MACQSFHLDLVSMNKLEIDFEEKVQIFEQIKIFSAKCFDECHLLVLKRAQKNRARVKKDPC